jgi:LacI family transcriptional regulator/LacI family repressor for deo operon, udp, cdd, tsx, nupC, and nupG
LGHRRIGYLGVPDRPKSNRRRLAGYHTALAAANITPDPALIMEFEAKTDFERGQAGLDQLLNAKATAIFCYNDVVAIGLLAACRRQGVAVPDQLAVVGFDDIESALYVTPPLTTISQPLLTLGQLAMQMTLDLLNEQDVQDQVLPCELVVRQSTAQISKTLKPKI